MAARPKATPIPVTIVGGFLGAGKTTLLNHVLSHDHGVRAGVLVNDFGAINVDAKLVVGLEGETVSLANGCVCCTIRDDLREACLELLKRREPPEHLLIETSGVSDPTAVVDTFLESDLGVLFSLNAVLTVADADQFSGLEGEAAAVGRAQVRAADIVVLNKVDLVGQDDLDELKRRVHEIAPGSRFIEVTHGRVPSELIFGAGSGPSPVQHRANRHDSPEPQPASAFAACHWESDRALSLPKLRAVLEALPDTVYRAKGIVHLEELPTCRVILQMVGKRSHLGDEGPWGSRQPRSEIVLVGSRGLDPEELRRSLDSCVGSGDDAHSPVLRLARKLALAPGRPPSGSVNSTARGPSTRPEQLPDIAPTA